METRSRTKVLYFTILLHSNEHRLHITVIGFPCDVDNSHLVRITTDYVSVSVSLPMGLVLRRS